MGLLALIAGTVTYLQCTRWWRCAGSRAGGGADAVVGGRGNGPGAAVGTPGGGSVASLAANVTVAQPTAVSRVIAAWPSFALIGAYELLMIETTSYS